MSKSKQNTRGGLIEIEDGNGNEARLLKEELDYYKDLWENSPELHVNVELDGNIKNCNRGICDRLGYKKDEIVGKSIFFVYHEDCMDDVKVAFNNFVSKGTVKDAELILKTKDGKKVPVLLNVTSKRDKKGNILYSRTTWQDLTEPQKAEQTIRESEKRLSQFINLSPAFIYLMDTELNLIDVNEIGIKLIGKGRKGVIGKNILDLSPKAKNNDRQDKYLQVIKTGKPYETLDEIKLTDGTIMYLNVKVFKMGAGLGIITTDLTELHHAREAIRESEEKYRFLLESITDGVSAFDKEGRYTIVNDEVAKMTGVPIERMLNSKLVDLFPNIEKTEYFKTYKRVLKSGKPATLVQEYTFEGGRMGWYENRVYPTPKGVLVITSDVTERKKAEHALKELNETLEKRVDKRMLELEKANKELEQYTNDLEKNITERKQAEEQFRTLFEQAGDAMFLIGGPEGHFIDVNRRACKALGYKREELLTLSAADINPGLSPKKFSALFESLALHKTITVETVYQRKDGSTFPVEIRGVRINVHGERRILSVARDITRSKKAEQAIKEKEKRFTQFINSSTASIHLFDSKLNLVDANKAGIKMTGKSRKEVIGKNILDIVPKVKESGRYNRHKQVIKTGRPYELLGEFEMSNGDNLYLDEKIFKVGDGLGIITTNLTEKYKVEKELKRYAKDIEMANKELQEFAYVAAHDLKAPLINLTALVDMIDSEIIADEEGKELFGKLKKSIGQLHKTVFALNDIIIFKTTLKDKKKRVNFEELFSEIKESIAEQLEVAQATIKQDFSQYPEINYPPLHLRSIMQNLLTNALKYKHPDKALKIKVKTTKSNGRMYLSVKDNGLGFDAEKYGEKLMRLFTRLHTHVEGKGVGMYIVKSIVDSHGGKIEVKSKPNKGTLFKIYLNDGEKDAEGITGRR